MFYHPRKMNKLVSTLCCISALSLSGCATNSTSGVDPYESVNRDIFHFNKDLDKYFGKPVSGAYNLITPEIVQTGVGNFFDNLKDINVALNNTLQGKYQKGGEDIGRFLLNSTIGLGGIFDVATEVGLIKHNEDFAQTLAVWGIAQGAYLVLPILGPITSRGVSGVIFDTATNPATYVGVPIRTLEMLNLRANSEAKLKMLDEAALDPYVFTREAFLQSRKNLIHDGQLELEEDWDSDVLLEEEDEWDTNISFDDKDTTSKQSDFKHISDTLNNTENSFEKTSRSFDEISNKVEKLKSQKRKYRY